MFDVLKWLSEDYYNNSASFDYYNLKSALDFSLIWNLFEANLCNKNASIDCLEKISLDYSINVEEETINGCISYFKNRYNSEEELNSKFTSVKIPKRKIEILKSALINPEPDTKTKLEALLLIAYRFRNNLFHGEKELRELSSQNSNFEVINRFLSVLLMQYKSTI